MGGDADFRKASQSGECFVAELHVADFAPGSCANFSFRNGPFSLDFKQSGSGYVIPYTAL